MERLASGISKGSIYTPETSMLLITEEKVE